MSENTEIRAALESLAAEPLSEQIDYYRKPFMVLWAAIQEAASGVAEDYDCLRTWRSCGWPNR